jgi:hypothetical protein
VEEILSQGYSGIELCVGVQASGRQEWQHLHKYPRYGIGFALFDVDSKDVIGNPSDFSDSFLSHRSQTKFPEVRLLLLRIFLHLKNSKPSPTILRF